MDSTPKKIKQILLIEDRERLELNDVVAILSFEDDYITLEVSAGNISISGSGLKIVDLSKETGHISITGKIGSVEYNETARKRRNSLFKGN